MSDGRCWEKMENIIKDTDKYNIVRNSVTFNKSFFSAIKFLKYLIKNINIKRKDKVLAISGNKPS